MRETKTAFIGFRQETLLPFSLTFVVIILDQMTKWMVVRYIEPLTEGGPIREIIGDFLRIVHARNPGIAFSIGRDMPEPLRSLLFTVIPILILGFMVYYYFRTSEFTSLQRWSLAGILGGGTGNLIDRVLRTDGVVDFIDVRFYGLFGLERWPTFNIADAAVVLCGILFALSIAFHDMKERPWERN